MHPPLRELPRPFAHRVSPHPPAEPFASLEGLLAHTVPHTFTQLSLGGLHPMSILSLPPDPSPTLGRNPVLVLYTLLSQPHYSVIS